MRRTIDLVVVAAALATGAQTPAFTQTRDSAEPPIRVSTGRTLESVFLSALRKRVSETVQRTKADVGTWQVPPL